MEDVLHYLKLKNLYYEKFYSETIKFMGQASENHWENLEFFVDNRERILGIIRNFDHKIEKLLKEQSISKSEVKTHKSEVKELLGRRKEIADRIVARDLELLTMIEDFKSETIKELKKTQKSGQQIHSFAVASGTTKQNKPIKEA